jgi:alpha-beta hydrolase superfamily lysophospholipase
MLLVHGYAEHSARYEELASWFAGRGVAFYGYDQRGHGGSGGVRCHVESFSEFLDDLEDQLAFVRRQHPELPLTLLGHSMGGLISLAYLVERRPTLSSAVVSGPALAAGQNVSRTRAFTARVLRRVVPRLVLGSGLDASGLSRDPEVVRRYVEDPLVVRTMTASLGAEMLDAAQRTQDSGAEVKVPLLLVHGEEDPLCPVAGSQTFAAAVSTPGSAFRSYPGLLHEIFNEPERESIYEDVWRWLEELKR